MSGSRDFGMFGGDLGPCQTGSAKGNMVEMCVPDEACMTGWAGWARAGAGRRGCWDLSGRVVRDGG